MKRMYTVVKFYQRHHEEENFIEVSFKDVIVMDAVSPITKTPKLDLSDEVQEWITDMTPFDKPLEETDKKDEMLSLNDLESQLWLLSTTSIFCTICLCVAGWFSIVGLMAIFPVLQLPSYQWVQCWRWRNWSPHRGCIETGMITVYYCEHISQRQ